MRRLAIIAAVFSADAAAAHDFWIQPREFAVAVDTPVALTIQVGHGAARQRWDAARNRIVAFNAIGNTGTTDLRPTLAPLGGPADATLRFARAGTYTVTFESTRAASELPSIRFNDYLKSEGLTPALTARAAAGASDGPGREMYSRRAKALIRVGPPGAPSPQVTRPAGMTLEIVPGRDPTAAEFNMSLPVTVLYDGRPLGGALVKLNNLDFDARPVATALTDPAGRATFAVPFKGLWQLNVVWTKPVRSAAADFDTVFSSLTFGWTRATTR